MKLKVVWGDGKTANVDDVTSFSKSWAGDEYVFIAKHPDGSETHYTGPELQIVWGKEDDEDER